MAIHRSVIAVILGAVLTVGSTEGPAHAAPSDLGCQRDVSALSALRSGLSLPPYFSDPNPVKRGGEFDPNRYFQTLPNLRMRDGFTLDYVYHQDGMGGYPLLYARPAGQPPFTDEAAYRAAGDQPSFLDFVIPSDTPEGYFEFAVLAMTANQFYRDWHANYNDWTVVCGTQGVEDIIGSLSGSDSFGRPMSAEQEQRARAIRDPLPTVSLDDRTATVTMVVFTKWGGFFRRTMVIDRGDHSIPEVNDMPLVEYDCGVAF